MKKLKSINIQNSKMSLLKVVNIQRRQDPLLPIPVDTAFSFATIILMLRVKTEIKVH